MQDNVYPVDWAQLLLKTAQHFGLCFALPTEWVGEGEPAQYLMWSLLPHLTSLPTDQVQDMKATFSNEKNKAFLGVKLNCRAPSSFARSILPDIICLLHDRGALQEAPEIWAEGFQASLSCSEVPTGVVRVLSDTSLAVPLDSQVCPGMPTELELHVSATSEEDCVKIVQFIEEMAKAASEHLTRAPAWSQEPQPSFKVNNWPAALSLETSLHTQLESSFAILNSSRHLNL